MGYFISGFISASLLALIVAWCCTDNAKETRTSTNMSPISPNEMAETILSNLSKVKMVQVRLGHNLPYPLAKEIVLFQEAHHIVLIPVEVEDIEDMADIEMQSKKPKKTLQEVKAKFANLGQLDLADDDTNGEEVA